VSNRNRRAVLIAVLAAAANLRLGVVQVGPVIERIRADTGASSGLAGVLTTIPFICSSVFAFAGSGMVRHIGDVATMRLALLFVTAGTLARAAAPTIDLMLAATVVIGLGVATLSVVLPSTVKLHFAERAGSVTGAYIASMSAFSALIAVVTVPLAEAFGDWRIALAAAAIPGLVALALWLRAPVQPPAPQLPEARKAHPRLRLVVTLALVYGLQSICFTTMTAWIAALYEDAGWPPGRAALATASIPILSVVSALLVPVISRPTTRRNWILAAGLTMSASLIGMATIPTTGAPLWLLAFGLGCGAIFPLVMTLPLDMREAPDDVARLTAWMLAFGFLIAAVGPAAAGALRDATGAFTLPVLLLAGCAAAAGVLARSPLLDESRRTLLRFQPVPADADVDR
jgi:CP family cyanate transporter-like MFS transporter